MAKDNVIEVGDFVKYKNYKMAVVAINEDKGTIHALCAENHKIATFGVGDPEATILKKGGCKSLVKAIYFDMGLIR